MKTLFIILLLIGGSSAHAKKVCHKTATGIYQACSDKPVEWTQEKQDEYDDMIGNAIDDVCEKSNRIARAQQIINHEKEVGKLTGYVNTVNIHDSGSIIAELKPSVDEDSKVILDYTGKPASNYECP